MGLRGPKSGFRDAQRELTGRIEQNGRPRFRRGDGKPFSRMSASAAKAWKRLISATEASGNIREAAYPVLQEAAQIVARLEPLWGEFDALMAAKNFADLDKLGLTIARLEDKLCEISIRCQLTPKEYAGAVEVEPANEKASRLEVILSGGGSRAS